MLVQFMLISGIVWVFCATLYVVSEMTIPDNTLDFCRRLNQAILIEWLSQLCLSLGLVLGGYLWFGIILLQVGCWHAIKHFQDGDPVSPQDAHKTKFRDAKTRFYTVKLIGYGFIFLALAFHMGVMMVDSLMAHPLKSLWSAP